MSRLFASFSSRFFRKISVRPSKNELPASLERGLPVVIVLLSFFFALYCTLPSESAEIDATREDPSVINEMEPPVGVAPAVSVPEGVTGESELAEKEISVPDTETTDVEAADKEVSVPADTTREADVTEKGVSGQGDEAEFAETPVVVASDPIEPWNRLMYHFNDRLYFWVLKPVSKGYNAILPEEFRASVRNFFNNIAMPVRFVNSLLQGNLKGAGNEIVRFVINSTLGMAGLYDMAKSRFNIEGRQEDLGLTLGRYGAGSGFYIVWPFIGPSTLRDTIGRVGDAFLSPLNYITPSKDAIAIESYDYFNHASLHIGEYEDLKESAIEPYVALRDAYLQHRKSLLKK
jgi:phospholipid-binding lipoprotein MlaA